MTTYIYELPDWPHFRWDSEAIAQKLAGVRYKQGELIGRMKCLGFSLREEATLQTLVLDAIKSSEIEGENLDKEQVRSSVARHLGMDKGALPAASRDVDGVVEMILEATRGYEKPLTAERLFGWHASLFPAGRSGMYRIMVGAWRDKSEVVSGGPAGHEHVYFEAPPPDRIESEMTAFIDWFNHDDGTDLVVRSCIAHLWFVTIHPFEDGNGRIARALADMLLARSEGSPQRFYSMSAEIRNERPAYYAGLEATQKGTLDITSRLEWFLDCLERALHSANNTLSGVLRKARFWETHSQTPLNARQRLILNRLLDPFEGKLTSSKWAKLAKCSQDTAGRDITDLVDHGILVKDSGGGRSTSYSLIFPDESQIS